MFESMGRGWRIAKESWTVLRRKPTLLAFPVCSGVAILLLLGLELGFIFVESTDPAGPLLILLAVVFGYFALWFVVLFFNAALVACALDAFSGRTPTVGGGLSAALRRLPQLLGWTLVAATVGLVLNILETLVQDKLGFLGALLSGLMDFAWSVVTYLVMPVLVVEGTGPIHAIKRSTAVLRRTWGEQVGGQGGLGIIGLLFMLPVLAPLPLGSLLQVAPKPVLTALAVVGAVYIVAVLVVFAALSTIFRSGTYLYATTGQVPSSLDPTLVQGAFQSRV